MSEAQWIYEYHALHKKETEDRKFHIDTLKNVLISVLGLRVPPLNEDGTPKPKEDMTDEDRESFVPLIFLAGNHHLLKKYFEKFPEEGSQPNPAQDAAFDELSRRMAEDDGDMVPIIDPYAGKTWEQVKETILKKQHDTLGVVTVDAEGTPVTKPVNIPQEPSKSKVRHTVSFEDPDAGTK
jgi:hypothetical protein